MTPAYGLDVLTKGEGSIFNHSVPQWLWPLYLQLHMEGELLYLWIVFDAKITKTMQETGKTFVAYCWFLLPNSQYHASGWCYNQSFHSSHLQTRGGQLLLWAGNVSNLTSVTGW